MLVPTNYSSAVDGRTHGAVRERGSVRHAQRAARRGARDADGLTAAERQVVENEARLAVVQRVLGLNGALDDVLGHLTSLGVKALETPFAAVSFVHRDRQVYKSAVGLSEPWRTRGEIPLSYSYCKHAVASGRMLVVDDARRSPLLRGNPSVRELGAIAYAGVPLVTADGHVLGTFNIIDSRPRVWSDAELEQLAELGAAVTGEIEVSLASSANEARLEDALRANNERLAMIVHDLRNYLNVISLGASLLADGESEPSERDRDVKRIQTSAQQMDRMIQDLLDAARLQDGRFPLRKCVLSADALVTEAAVLLRPLAEKKGVTLVAQPAAPGHLVEADRDAISRVLANLIGNAVKFTPSGGSITVRSRDAGAEVVYAVADTGAGIASCELDRVFDRFWQSRSHHVPGAGLGLAIARALVEAHGGRIWAESGRGAGTTFYFALPVVLPA